MNIDDQVNSIVQNVVTEITTKVQAQALDAINKRVAEVIGNLDYTALVSQKLDQLLSSKINQLPINTKSLEGALTLRVEELAQSFYKNVQTKSVDITTNAINNYVNKVDFHALCQSALLGALAGSSFEFPQNSISADAVQKSNFNLSGSNISGGIIKNFGSTGIDDKSTDCRLSIFDEITVVENNLLTKDLTVKGTATIEGDLNITGTVDPESEFYKNLLQTTSERVKNTLDGDLFRNYATVIFNQIRDEGLDLGKITLNGKEVISDRTLANSITESNIQKLGYLKELNVNGEAMLSQTLYTTTKRVGINTIEPGMALSVWDEEIEISTGKLSNNVGIISAPRNQSLVIGSNGRNNLTVNPDGSVTVDTLRIGETSITSSLTPPSDNRPKGAIVFNANPSLGGPLGWVSLGNASWANFGIID